MKRDLTPKPRCAGRLALAAAVLLLAPGGALALDLSADTGVIYTGWRSSDGGRGTQLYVPIRASGEAGDFSAALLTAYAYDAMTDRAVEASIRGFVDTKVGTSYAMTGRLPVDILLGLDLNLPTGRAKFSSDELRLAESLDPELVTITSLGEGFNVNPTLAAAKSWGNIGIGLGIGYLWRGTYDPGAHLQGYDPGDVGSVTGEARWLFAPDWSARVVAKYSRYGRDRLDGDPTFREGDFASLLVALSRTVDRWEGSLSVQGIYRGKSEVVDSSGDLTREDSNSHGAEYRGTASVRYALSDAAGLTASLGGLFVAHNGYSDSEDRYVGTRKKVSLTVGGSRRLASRLEGRLGLTGFWMADGETHLPAHRDPTLYRGVTGTASLSASF